MSRRQAVRPEMARVAGQIATWRAERERVEPMPEELWCAAVELAEEHEVGPTSRGLEIDFGGLQRRVKRSREEREKAAEEARRLAESDESEPPRKEPVRFVELPSGPLMPPASTETTVEVTRPDGAAMTVRIPGDGPPDVGALVAAFLGRGR